MIDGLGRYPRYTDSGIPWAGELPIHWKIERPKWLFSKMTRPVRDQDEVVTCFRDGVVTLRRNRRLRGFTEALKEHGYQGIRRGDLVIHAMDAFAGAVGVADSDGKGSPVYAVCMPCANINASYYAYVVREMARAEWILALSRGIRERSTDFRYDTFGSQPVPVPPFEEQAAIVNFLDYADRQIRRYIRAKQRLIKLLEEQKQAIIHQAVTRGLDPNVRLKFAEATSLNQVSWLGLIPEHWEIVSAKRLFVMRAERACDDDEQLSATQAYGVIPQAEFERRVGRRVVKIFRHLDKRRHVESGDFVISMRSFEGGLERAWASGCIRSSYVVLRPCSDVDVDFFAYLFKSHGYIQALRATSNFIRDGQDMKYGNFCMVDLPKVPCEEQRAIAQYIAGATAEQSAASRRARREIELLKEYRTRLIADVVTGQLDVREAVANLPDLPPDTDDEPLDEPDSDDDEEPDAAPDEPEED